MWHGCGSTRWCHNTVFLDLRRALSLRFEAQVNNVPLPSSHVYQTKTRVSAVVYES